MLLLFERLAWEVLLLGNEPENAPLPLELSWEVLLMIEESSQELPLLLEESCWVVLLGNTPENAPLQLRFEGLACEVFVPGNAPENAPL